MDHGPDNEKRETSGAGFQPVTGSKIASDFAGAVLGCTIIGWGIDRWWGTKPWGIVVMVVMGFCVGIYSAWRSLAPPGKD